MGDELAFRFRGDVASITGGAIGLGRAFARALSAEDACAAEGSFITGETIKVSGGFPLNF